MREDAHAPTHTHTHKSTVRGEKNNLPQKNFSFRLKTNDMDVLRRSLGRVTPFLCKYNFMVHFQLLGDEWQAGLWLGLQRESLQSREEACSARRNRNGGRLFKISIVLVFRPESFHMFAFAH